MFLFLKFGCGNDDKRALNPWVGCENLKLQIFKISNFKFQVSSLKISSCKFSILSLKSQIPNFSLKFQVPNLELETWNLKFEILKICNLRFSHPTQGFKAL